MVHSGFEAADYSFLSPVNGAKCTSDALARSQFFGVAVDRGLKLGVSCCTGSPQVDAQWQEA